MINHDIRIVEDDDAVFVDGVRQRIILLGKMSERINYITWAKKGQTGYIQLRNGEEYNFTDEALISGLLEKWLVEGARDIDEDEATFAARHRGNSFDIADLVGAGRAAKAAAIAAKVDAERESKAAWQAALDTKRDERPARVAAAQQNRLTARKAAEDKARNERAEAAKGKAHGRP